MTTVTFTGLKGEVLSFDNTKQPISVQYYDVQRKGYRQSSLYTLLLRTMLSNHDQRPVAERQFGQFGYAGSLTASARKTLQAVDLRYNAQGQLVLSLEYERPRRLTDSTALLNKVRHVSSFTLPKTDLFKTLAVNEADLSAHSDAAAATSFLNGLTETAVQVFPYGTKGPKVIASSGDNRHVVLVPGSSDYAVVLPGDKGSRISSKGALRDITIAESGPDGMVVWALTRAGHIEPAVIRADGSFDADASNDLLVMINSGNQRFVALTTTPDGATYALDEAGHLHSYRSEDGISSFRRSIAPVVPLSGPGSLKVPTGRLGFESAKYRVELSVNEATGELQVSRLTNSGRLAFSQKKDIAALVDRDLGKLTNSIVETKANAQHVLRDGAVYTLGANGWSKNASGVFGAYAGMSFQGLRSDNAKTAISVIAGSDTVLQKTDADVFATYHFDIGRAHLLEASVEGGTAYALGSDGVLYFKGARNGSFDLASQRLKSFVIDQNSTVLAVALDGRVIRFDLPVQSGAAQTPANLVDETQISRAGHDTLALKQDSQRRVVLVQSDQTDSNRVSYALLKDATAGTLEPFALADANAKTIISVSAPGDEVVSDNDGHRLSLSGGQVFYFNHNKSEWYSTGLSEVTSLSLGADGQFYALSEANYRTETGSRIETTITQLNEFGQPQNSGNLDLSAEGLPQRVARAATVLGKVQNFAVKAGGGLVYADADGALHTLGADAFLGGNAQVGAVSSAQVTALTLGDLDFATARIEGAQKAVEHNGSIWVYTADNELYYSDASLARGSEAWSKAPTLVTQAEIADFALLEGAKLALKLSDGSYQTANADGQWRVVAQPTAVDAGDQPALNAGETLVDLTAHNDGTVWALTSDGRVLTQSATGSKAWVVRDLADLGGQAPRHLQTGSDGNVIITTSDNATHVFRANTAAAGQPDNSGFTASDIVRAVPLFDKKLADLNFTRSKLTFVGEVGPKNSAFSEAHNGKVARSVTTQQQEFTSSKNFVVRFAQNLRSHLPFLKGIKHSPQVKQALQERKEAWAEIANLTKAKSKASFSTGSQALLDDLSQAFNPQNINALQDIEQTLRITDDNGAIRSDWKQSAGYRQLKSAAVSHVDSLGGYLRAESPEARLKRLAADPKKNVIRRVYESRHAIFGDNDVIATRLKNLLDNDVFVPLASTDILPDNDIFKRLELSAATLVNNQAILVEAADRTRRTEKLLSSLPADHHDGVRNRVFASVNAALQEKRNASRVNQLYQRNFNNLDEVQTLLSAGDDLNASLGSANGKLYRTLQNNSPETANVVKAYTDVIKSARIGDSFEITTGVDSAARLKLNASVGGLDYGIGLSPVLVPVVGIVEGKVGRANGFTIKKTATGVDIKLNRGKTHGLSASAELVAGLSHDPVSHSSDLSKIASGSLAAAGQLNLSYARDTASNTNATISIKESDAGRLTQVLTTLFSGQLDPYDFVVGAKSFGQDTTVKQKLTTALGVDADVSLDIPAAGDYAASGQRYRQGAKLKFASAGLKATLFESERTEKTTRQLNSRGVGKTSTESTRNFFSSIGFALGGPASVQRNRFEGLITEAADDVNNGTTDGAYGSYLVNVETPLTSVAGRSGTLAEFTGEAQFTTSGELNNLVWKGTVDQDFDLLKVADQRGLSSNSRLRKALLHLGSFASERRRGQINSELQALKQRFSGDTAAQKQLTQLEKLAAFSRSSDRKAFRKAAQDFGKAFGVKADVKALQTLTKIDSEWREKRPAIDIQYSLTEAGLTVLKQELEKGRNIEDIIKSDLSKAGNSKISEVSGAKLSNSFASNKGGNLGGFRINSSAALKYTRDASRIRFLDNDTQVVDALVGKVSAFASKELFNVKDAALTDELKSERNRLVAEVTRVLGIDPETVISGTDDAILLENLQTLGDLTASNGQSAVDRNVRAAVTAIEKLRAVAQTNTITSDRFTLQGDVAKNTVTDNFRDITDFRLLNGRIANALLQPFDGGYEAAAKGLSDNDALSVSRRNLLSSLSGNPGVSPVELVRTEAVLGTLAEEYRTKRTLALVDEVEAEVNRALAADPNTDVAQLYTQLLDSKTTALETEVNVLKSNLLNEYGKLFLVDVDTGKTGTRAEVAAFVGSDDFAPIFALKPEIKREIRQHAVSHRTAIETLVQTREWALGTKTADNAGQIISFENGIAVYRDPQNPDRGIRLSQATLRKVILAEGGRILQAMHEGFTGDLELQNTDLRQERLQLRAELADLSDSEARLDTAAVLDDTRSVFGSTNPIRLLQRVKENPDLLYRLSPAQTYVLTEFFPDVSGESFDATTIIEKVNTPGEIERFASNVQRLITAQISTETLNQPSNARPQGAGTSGENGNVVFNGPKFSPQNLHRVPGVANSPSDFRFSQIRLFKDQLAALADSVVQHLFRRSKQKEDSFTCGTCMGLSEQYLRELRIGGDRGARQFLAWNQELHRAFDRNVVVSDKGPQRIDKLITSLGQHFARQNAQKTLFDIAAIQNSQDEVFFNGEFDFEFGADPNRLHVPAIEYLNRKHRDYGLTNVKPQRNNQSILDQQDFYGFEELIERFGTTNESTYAQIGSFKHAMALSVQVSRKANGEEARRYSFFDPNFGARFFDTIQDLEATLREVFNESKFVETPGFDPDTATGYEYYDPAAVNRRLAVGHPNHRRIPNPETQSFALNVSLYTESNNTLPSKYDQVIYDQGLYVLESLALDKREILVGTNLTGHVSGYDAESIELTVQDAQKNTVKFVLGRYGDVLRGTSLQETVEALNSLPQIDSLPANANGQTFYTFINNDAPVLFSKKPAGNALRFLAATDDTQNSLDGLRVAQIQQADIDLVTSRNNRTLLENAVFQNSDLRRALTDSIVTKVTDHLILNNFRDLSFDDLYDIDAELKQGLRYLNVDHSAPVFTRMNELGVTFRAINAALPDKLKSALRFLRQNHSNDIENAEDFFDENVADGSPKTLSFQMREGFILVNDGTEDRIASNALRNALIDLEGERLTRVISSGYTGEFRLALRSNDFIEAEFGNASRFVKASSVDFDAIKFSHYKGTDPALIIGSGLQVSQLSPAQIIVIQSLIPAATPDRSKHHQIDVARFTAAQNDPIVLAEILRQVNQREQALTLQERATQESLRPQVQGSGDSSDSDSAADAGEAGPSGESGGARSTSAAAQLERLATWNGFAQDVSAQLFRIAGQVGGTGSRPVITAVPQAFFVGAANDGILANGDRVRGQCGCLGLGYLHSLAQGNDGTGGRKFLEGVQLHSLTLKQAAEEQGKTSQLEFSQTERFQETVRVLEGFNDTDNEGVLTSEGSLSLKDVVQRLKSATGDVYFQVNTGNHSIAVSKQVIGRRHQYRWYDPNFGEIAVSENSAALGAVKLEHIVREYLNLKSEDGTWNGTLSDFYDTRQQDGDLVFDVKSFDTAKANSLKSFTDVSTQVLSGGYESELDRLAALDARDGKVTLSGADFTRVELYEMGAVIDGRYVNAATDFGASDFASKVRYAPGKLGKFLSQRQYDKRTEAAAKLLKTALDASSGDVSSLLVKSSDTDPITLERATFALEAVRKHTSVVQGAVNVSGDLYSDLSDIDTRIYGTQSGVTQESRAVSRLNNTSNVIDRVSSSYGQLQSAIGLANLRGRNGLTAQEKSEQDALIGTTIGGEVFGHLDEALQKGVTSLGKKLDRVGSRLGNRGSVSFRAPSSKIKLAGAKLSKGLNAAAKGVGRIATRAARGVSAAGGAAIGVLGAAFDVYGAVDAFSKLSSARPEEREGLIVGGSLSVVGAAVGVGVAIGTAAAVAAGAGALAAGLGVAGAALGALIAIGAGIYGGVKQIEALSKHIKLSAGDKAEVVLLSIFGQSPPASLSNAAERAATRAAAEDALKEQVSKLPQHYINDALSQATGIGTVFYSEPNLRIVERPRIDFFAREKRNDSLSFFRLDLTTSEAVEAYKEAEADGRYYRFGQRDAVSGRKQYIPVFDNRNLDVVNANTGELSSLARRVEADPNGSAAHFNLGYGGDLVTGYRDRVNYFTVFDGIYDGGSKDDVFLIDYARRPQGLLKSLRGNGGSDTIVYVDTQDYVDYDVLADLDRGYIKVLSGNDEHVLYNLSGIENFIGDQEFADTINGTAASNYLDTNGFSKNVDNNVETVYGLAGDDTIVLYHKTVAHGGEGNDIFRVSLTSSIFTHNELTIHEEAGETKEINTVLLDMSVAAVTSVQLSGNDVIVNLRDGNKTAALRLKDLYRDSASGGKELVAGKQFVFSTSDGFVLSPLWPETLAAGASLPTKDLFLAQYVSSSDQTTGSAVAVDLSIAADGSSTHITRTISGSVVRSTKVSPLFRVLAGAGALDDYIRGGADEDVLTAGHGNDTLEGGAGSDLYTVRADLSEIETLSLSPNQYKNTDLGEKVIRNSAAAKTITQADGKTETIYDIDLVRFGVRREDMGYRTEGQDLVIFYKPDESRAAKIRIKDFLVSEQHRHISIVDATGSIFETEIDDDGKAHLSVEGTLIGEGGDDRLLAGAVTTNVIGGKGNDVLLGKSGRGEAGDNLFGGAGDDILLGASGDDVLIGADGDDEIRDSHGDALIQTGNGVDRVVFEYDATGVKLIDLNNTDNKIDRISVPFDLAGANFARNGDSLVVQGQAPDATQGQLLHIVLKDYFTAAKYQQVSLQSYRNIGELDYQAASVVNETVVTPDELRSRASLASYYNTQLLEDKAAQSTLGEGLVSNRGVYRLTAGVHEFEVEHGSFVAFKIDGQPMRLNPVAGRPGVYRFRHHVTQAGYQNIEMSYLQETGESVPVLSRIGAGAHADDPTLTQRSENLLAVSSFDEVPAADLSGDTSKRYIVLSKTIYANEGDVYHLSFTVENLEFLLRGSTKTITIKWGDEVIKTYDASNYESAVSLQLDTSGVTPKTFEIIETIPTNKRLASSAIQGLNLQEVFHKEQLSTDKRNLVRNGSFEIVKASDGAQGQTDNGIATVVPEGWQASFGTPDVQDTTVFNSQTSQFGHTASGYGDKIVELAGASNSGIYQDLDTAVGESYRISLQYRGQAALSAEANTIEVWWNGSKVGSIAATHTDWRTYSFEVTGTDTSRLELRAAGSNGTLGAALDNVMVHQIDDPNLVKNGSFEVGQISGTVTPHVNPGISFGVPDGWTVASGTPEVHDTTLFNNETSRFGHSASGYGDKILELAGATNASIYQDLDTDAGKEYRISLSYRGLDQVSAAENTVEVWWAGTKVGTIAATHSDWRTYSFDVTGLDTSRLELRATGQNGTLGAALDNVEVRRFDYRELVTNGSFEVGQKSGTIPDHNIAGLSRGIPDGWTLSFGDLEVHDTSVFNDQVSQFGHSSSGYGDKIVELAGVTNSGIYQDLDTTAGDAYEISLSYRGLAAVSADANTIEVWWAGAKVGEIAETHSDWREYRFKVTGADTSRLELKSSGPNGTLGAAIDNVSVKRAKLKSDHYRADRIFESSEGPVVNWQGRVVFGTAATSVAEAEQTLVNAGRTEVQTYTANDLSFAGAAGDSIATYLGSNASDYTGDSTQSYSNAVHNITGQVYLHAGLHTFQLDHDGPARLRIGGETVLNSNIGDQGTATQFAFTAERNGFFDLDLLYGQGTGAGTLRLQELRAGHDPKQQAATVYGANLVQGGDFESATITRVLTPERRAATLTNWQLSNYAQYGQADDVAVLEGTASQGNALVLGNQATGAPATLSQNITVQAGQRYELSFKVDLARDNLDHQLQVLWDGEPVDVLVKGGVASQTVTVVVDGGTGGDKTLSFRMLNPSATNRIKLDDIALRKVHHVAAFDAQNYQPVLVQTVQGTGLQPYVAEQTAAAVAQVATDEKDYSVTSVDASGGSTRWRGRVVFGQQLATLDAAETAFAQAKQSDIQTYDVTKLSFLSGYKNDVGSYLSEGAENYTGDSDQNLAGSSHHLEGQMYLSAGDHSFLVRHDDYARIRINGKDVLTVAGTDDGIGQGQKTFTFRAETAGYYSFDILHGQKQVGAQFQLQEIVSGRDASGQYHAYRPGNLIQNGSFEIREKSALQETHTVDGLSFLRPLGWSVFSAKNAEVHDTRVFNDKTSIYGHSGSGHGNHVLELDGQGNTSIAQRLETVAGEPYKISFLYRGLPSVSADSNTIQVGWDRKIVGEVAATHSDWRRYSFVVPGGTFFTGATLLEFVAQGASDNLGAAIDDVQVHKFNDGNLVTNGTFERLQQNANTPAHSINGISLAVPEGWTASFGQIEVHDTDVFNSTVSDFGHSASGHGRYVLELDGTQNSGIYQDIATKAGASYTLSLFYRGLSSTSTESNTVEVWWGGTKVGTIADTHADWREYSFNVTGGTGTDRLELKAAGSSDTLGAAIDNVSVVEDRFVKTLTADEYRDPLSAAPQVSPAARNIQEDIAAARADLADQETRLAFDTATDEKTIANGDQADNRLISLTAKNATLYGHGGNDILEGGAGTDNLFGGDGDDVFISAGNTDALHGGAGSDTADYSYLSGTEAGYYLFDLKRNLTLRYSDAALQNLLNVGDTYTSIENIIGSVKNDHLVGDDNKNALDGGRGNDRINGNGGDDQLSGGEGNDTLTGDAGNDVLEGGAGNDHLTGGQGNDLLSGGAGNDHLQDGAGNDTLRGGSGDDTIALSSGFNVVDGGAGTDTLHLHHANPANASYYVSVNLETGVMAQVSRAGLESEHARLSGGNDKRSFLGTFIDTVKSSFTKGEGRVSRVENVKGTAVSDLITGNDAANRIESGAGNDFIRGGKGDDHLIGGADHDLYVVSSGDGNNIIEDRSGYDILVFNDAYYDDTSTHRYYNIWLERIAGTNDLSVVTLGKTATESQTVKNYFAGQKIEEIVVGKSKLVGSAKIDALIQSMAGLQTRSFSAQASDGSNKTVIQRAHELWVNE
jgi:Ca2+-binding RTX toxin-like protein